MARSKRKAVYLDKIEQGGYVALPHVVLRSSGFKSLSSHAVKLLIDLISQYLGSNNGDFCAPFSLMKKDRGWKSKGTLNRAIKELVESGFVEVSRQGGRHKCSLYAVTFYAVDECSGKIDIRATSKPTSLWKKNEPLPDISKLQKIKKEKEDAVLMGLLVQKMQQ